ncbi:hypothetical protein [Angustibacter luteus]|uniref:ARB-07466-like C-terminal domain-containing protein n=1 Tax=Angustibacter luteus TaxID=658456 RepID=A0ABW1JHW9_9ACTN
MRTFARRPVHAVVVVLAVCASVLLATTNASASPLSEGRLPTFGKAIEGYAPYQPQLTCSAGAQKGAVLMSRWLLKRYPGSSSSGIMRGCTVGSRSEHKDGRAFDWHVDFRTKKGKAQGLAFLNLARATDRYGNQHAIARRLGIMYIIWNDRIYSASNGFHARPYRNGACPPGPLSKCSSTLRHRDHMHISLGWSGAKAVTSFFDGTVAGVTFGPRPVLNQVKHPVVTVRVPATEKLVHTEFALRKGTKYRLVATGYYRAAAGTRLADAGCSWRNDNDLGWSPQAQQTTSTTKLKLRVGTSAGWAPARGLGRCDTTSHTYVWDYTPSVTAPMTLSIDDGLLTNNSGGLTLRVLRAGASTAAYTTTVPAAPKAPTTAYSAPSGPELTAPETVPVDAVHGGRSAGWLRAGQPYTLTVSGTWRAGEGLLADAECTKAPTGQWALQRSSDPLHPALDSYDLFANGTAVVPDVAGCQSSHTYTYTYVPAQDTRLSLAVWDTASSDDSGALAVQVEPRVS